MLAIVVLLCSVLLMIQSMLEMIIRKLLMPYLLHVLLRYILPPVTVGDYRLCGILADNLIAIVEALTCFNVSLTQVKVLSLGSGIAKKHCTGE